MNTGYWSFAAGCCKIKTARQKKRLLKKDLHKQLLAIDREEDLLYKNIRALPLILLAEPYQKGWKRTFTLREDVARSKQAGFYQALLKKMNTTEYSADKKFTRKKRRKTKKIYEVRPQLLREFYTHEWNHPKCKLTTEEKAHFHVRENWDMKLKKVVRKYVFNEPWRFVLQVKPNMITHSKMVDPALEAALQQLKNHIKSNLLRPFMNHLKYGQTYGRRREIENERQKNPLKNKPLYRILEAVANDDL